MKLPLSPSLSLSSNQTAPAQNLRRLEIIRWLLLATLVISLIVANKVLSVDLHFLSITLIIALLVLANIFTHFRLNLSWPVTHLEFGGQILFDILTISFLFYVSGGATNPFVSYYLVPLIISAATLPWIYTVGFTLLCLAAYTFLLFWYIPIAELEPMGEHANHSSGFNPHIVGMWFNFLLSAGLITFFIVRMSTALREQESQLNAHREEGLRDEQVLAVATLAAGTAHELGSPLTTIKLLLGEIEQENSQNAVLLKDIDTIKKQVDLCSSTLKQLTARAEVEDLQNKNARPVKQYCQSVIERWMLIRPDALAKVTYQGDTKITAVFHPTIDQAIINLLNNAADASEKQIDIGINWDSNNLDFTIADQGAGVPVEIKQQVGKPFVTTKKKGLGLGLFLSNATITRYGGSIGLEERPEGGTVTRIQIPLKQKHIA